MQEMNEHSSALGMPWMEQLILPSHAADYSLNCASRNGTHVNGEVEIGGWMKPPIKNCRLKSPRKELMSLLEIFYLLY